MPAWRAAGAVIGPRILLGASLGRLLLIALRRLVPGRLPRRRFQCDGSANLLAEAATAKSRAAEVRARRLLTRLLSEQQLRDLEKHGCFTVAVPDRGTFCILPRSTFNVVHVQSGDLYCCTTEGFVPVSDLMLTQKLLLENEPDRFFAVANCRREIFPDPHEQMLRGGWPGARDQGWRWAGGARRDGRTADRGLSRS